MRAEVTEHDVITMVFALPCTAFPVGKGHSEIPFLCHVGPSSHELLTGTSPQHDLLLCVLIKAAWYAIDAFPSTEGKLYPGGLQGIECGQKTKSGAQLKKVLC